MTEKTFPQIKVIATFREDTGLNSLDCRVTAAPSQLQSTLQVKEGNQSAF